MGWQRDPRREGGTHRQGDRAPPHRRFPLCGQFTENLDTSRSVVKKITGEKIRRGGVDVNKPSATPCIHARARNTVITEIHPKNGLPPKPPPIDKSSHKVGIRFAQVIEDVGAKLRCDRKKELGLRTAATAQRIQLVTNRNARSKGPRFPRFLKPAF